MSDARPPEAARLAECLDEALHLRGTEAQLLDFLAAVDRSLDAWVDYKKAQRKRERAATEEVAHAEA